MNEFSEIIETIKNSDLLQEEKDFLVAKLGDPAVSDQDKAQLVADFIDGKSTALDQEEATVTGPIYKEAEEEMAQAEREYTATMKSLEAEAEKLNQDTDDALAQTGE